MLDPAKRGSGCRPHPDGSNAQEAHLQYVMQSHEGYGQLPALSEAGLEAHGAAARDAMYGLHHYVDAGERNYTDHQHLPPPVERQVSIRPAVRSLATELDPKTGLNPLHVLVYLNICFRTAMASPPTSQGLRDEKLPELHCMALSKSSRVRRTLILRRTSTTRRMVGWFRRFRTTTRQR